VVELAQFASQEMSILKQQQYQNVDQSVDQHSFSQPPEQRVKLSLYIIPAVWLAYLLTPASAYAAMHPTSTFTSISNQVNARYLAQKSAAATTLWVNPETGSDTQGNGDDKTPYKTITKALSLASAGTVIQLSSGTYNAQTGEEFPLKLKSNVTLQGDPKSQGKGIVIQGGGFYLSRTSAQQNIAVLGADGATLTGVTVTNPNPRGYGLWIESSAPKVTGNTFTGNTHDGISVVGQGNPQIQNNYFAKNGANGITIFGTARSLIQNNVFENTGFGINVGAKATPQIEKNLIRYNKDGIILQASARPVLRGNTIERNLQDGLVAIAQAAPDLGSKSDPGSNVFRNNGRFDVNNSTKATVELAYGNQWSSNRINGSVNAAGTSTPASVPGVAYNPTRLAAPIPPSRAIRTTPTTAPAAELPPLPTVTANSETPPVKIPIRSTPNTPKPLSNGAGNLPQVASSTALPSLRPVVQSNASNPVTVSVPAPETSSFASPSASSGLANPTVIAALPSPPSNSGLPSLDAAPLPNNVLPVPGENIPLGNSGDISMTAAPPPPVNLASLRYRVVVYVEGEGVPAKVKTLIPGAFQTTSKGKAIMQAGAFSDRAKADELVQQLSSNGLQASVEPYN
jgi:parallel beta-helix repeat protein